MYSPLQCPFVLDFGKHCFWQELPHPAGPLILDNHGVFYPQALHNDLVSELTLVPASQVVKGLDASKQVNKLTNIQMEYETIRSWKLADEATSMYNSSKEFYMMSNNKLVEIVFNTAMLYSLWTVYWDIANSLTVKIFHEAVDHIKDIFQPPRFDRCERDDIPWKE